MLQINWLGNFLEGWLFSLLVMIIIILSAKWHQRWSAGPKEAVQKIHEGLVPRIGGIAIIAGVWFSVAVIGGSIHPLIVSSLSAMSLIFAIGLAEDVTGSIKVSHRLMLTFIPGAIVCYTTQIYLSRLGFPLFDPLLSNPWFAILFTAFALAGVTHAFNMIDGLNGLSGYTTLWILGAYLAIAYSYDDRVVMQICLLLAAPVLGFMVFNWPWGKCFLGDGGAYFLGFSCAWIGVLIVSRNPQVSPFAPLLICAYPIIEALFSMARRARIGQSSGLPDRFHLHQIMVSGFVDPWLKAHPGSVKSNSIAGLLVSNFPVPFLALAWFFNANQGVLIGLLMLSLVLYSFMYSALRAKVASRYLIDGAHQINTSGGAHIPKVK